MNTKQNKDKISRNSSHLSGEYFVAAELYRRGFEIGMTIGNAKSIDILAHKDGKSYSIQVKTIQAKQSTGWNIMKNNVKKDIIYIFVNLNKLESPDYYILCPNEVLPLIQEYGKRGIISLGKINKEYNKNNWTNFEIFK